MMHRWLTYALATLGVAACGNSFKPEQYATPQSLLQASLVEYESGNCGGAERGFRRVTLELPPRDSGVAVARFFLGECLLRQGDYLEASREFQRVANDHPRHERAPHALLRAGDALARLWKRPELDPTYAQNAMSMYSELLGRYPQSEAADTARERVTELGDKFALKDLKNGEFYERLHAYDSAIIYYRNVVANYANSTHAPTALMRLVAVYRRIGYEEDARETCAHLRRFHPDADGLDRICPATTDS